MSLLFKDRNGNTAQIINPDIQNIQTVAIGAASTQTSNPVPDVKLVMLWSDVDCCFNVGPNPTAAVNATSIPLSAKTYFYQPVTARTDKIAVIQYSSSGTLWVIPGQ
jgi:hypothetical protein